MKRKFPLLQIKHMDCHSAVSVDEIVWICLGAVKNNTPFFWYLCRISGFVL